MSVLNAVRRLLKSRLRLYLAERLAATQRGPDLASFIEVEKGIGEEAWSDWQRLQSGAEWESLHYSNLRLIVGDALREAADSARGTFRDLVDRGWLEHQLGLYTKDFRLEKLFVAPMQWVNKEAG